MTTEPLTFETTLSLRWRDIDTLGHLNQSVYHELLEEARVGLLTELHRRVAGEPGPGPGALVVRHVDIDYHHEIRRTDERVVAAVAVRRVGTTSIQLDQEIRLLDGTVAASGMAVLVGWDRERRGKRELNDVERAALGARP